MGIIVDKSNLDYKKLKNFLDEEYLQKGQLYAL